MGALKIPGSQAGVPIDWHLLARYQRGLLAPDATNASRSLISLPSQHFAGDFPPIRGWHGNCRHESPARDSLGHLA